MRRNEHEIGSTSRPKGFSVREPTANMLMQEDFLGVQAFQSTGSKGFRSPLLSLDPLARLQRLFCVRPECDPAISTHVLKS